MLSGELKFGKEGVYRTPWISKCIEDYFWSEISADVNVNFVTLYKGIFLKIILFRAVLDGRIKPSQIKFNLNLS